MHIRVYTWMLCHAVCTFCVMAPREASPVGRVSSVNSNNNTRCGYGDRAPAAATRWQDDDMVETKSRTVKTQQVHTYVPRYL